MKDTIKRCDFGEVRESSGHPYLRRCRLAPDHKGQHVLASAQRLLWEDTYGVPPPARVGGIEPVDGNWLNLDIDNWKVVSNSQRNLARHAKAREERGESTHKYCKECEGYLPLEDFPPRRNTCKDCWKQRLRNNTRNRANHIQEFNCYLIGDEHFHVKTYKDMLDYTFALYFISLREEYPDQDRYRLAVARTRSMLRRGILSNSERFP